MDRMASRFSMQSGPLRRVLLSGSGRAGRALCSKDGAWNEEWRRLGLGAIAVQEQEAAPSLNRLMFVQTGFGCDQHGDRKGAVRRSVSIRRHNARPTLFAPRHRTPRAHQIETHVQGATSAAVRACRNAIEFNSIPGMIDHVPGGRKNMLIHVKLGVPEGYAVDHDQIRATFPYGRLLPVEVVNGGLTYGCGRCVRTRCTAH